MPRADLLPRSVSRAYGLAPAYVLNVTNGLAHKGALIKILGRGEITRKVTVKAHAFSKTASSAVTAAGHR
jgi:ribosomal protein L15